MTTEKITKLLKDYKCRDCRVQITEISYSEDDSFSLGMFGAPYVGVPIVDVNTKTLHDWKVRPFFCIKVTLSGGPGSTIHGMILIPEKDWNEKIVFQGNGGPASSLKIQAALSCLYEPYAVLHCDLGTSDIDVGLSSASGVIDHGWRATHLMTVVGKDIVELVCGKPAKHSYIVGMSTGGQQAIAAPTVCPDDFDGAVACAPGISRAYLHTFFVWGTKYLTNEDGSSKFTPEEIAAVHDVVIDYHKRHGYGAPGDDFVSVVFSEKERQEVLDEIEATGKFTADQMESLRAFYQGPVNPETGEKIYCGFTMGAETLMGGMMGYINVAMASGNIWLDGWAAGMPNEEFVNGGYRKFDFAKDVDSPMMRKIATDMNADSGDLAEFRARGGKMIVASGLMDEFIPPQNVIDWYERVIAKQGGLDTTQEFCRLFLVPGYGHTWNSAGINWVTGEDELEESMTYFRSFVCGGVNLLKALDKWVCEGVAPDQLVALDTKGALGMTPDITTGITRERPVYPYPDVPEYVSGDPDQFDSFRRKKGQLGQYDKPRTGRYEAK